MIKTKVSVILFSLPLIVTLFSFSVPGLIRNNGGTDKGDKLTDTKNPIINEAVASKSSQYTLINTWASYNAESRLRNVQFNNTSNALQGKLKVIGISFDEYVSVYEATVQADGLNTSLNICETNGFNSKIAKKLDIENGKFENFLLDANGVIVKKNVTPQELKDIVSSHS